MENDEQRQDQEESELGIGGTTVALIFIFGIVWVLGSAMDPTKVMAYSERGTAAGAAFGGDEYDYYRLVAGCRIDGELGVQTRDGNCTSMLEVKDRVIESGRESLRRSDTPDYSRQEAMREVMTEFNVDQEGVMFIAYWIREKGYVSESCGQVFGSCEPTSKYWIQVYQGLPENYSSSSNSVSESNTRGETQ